MRRRWARLWIALGLEQVGSELAALERSTVLESERRLARSWFLLGRWLVSELAWPLTALFGLRARFH
jgi:hypothetical protein